MFLLILALFLNNGLVMALNKRGFALTAYTPKTGMLNRPIPFLNQPIRSHQNSQRANNYDQQQSGTALSAAYGRIVLLNVDQLNSQNNEDSLRLLSTFDQLQLPMIVHLGAASRRYFIVSQLESNYIYNSYEVYMMNGEYVSRTPLILKAFFQDQDKNADRYLKKELKNQLQKKMENIVVDRPHSIIVYGDDTDLFHDVSPEGKQTTILPPLGSQGTDSDKGLKADAQKPHSENGELDDLVDDIVYLKNFPVRAKLDDETMAILFDHFLKKLEKGEYQECRAMIRVIDADTAEKWTELLHRDQKISWF